MIDIAWFIYTDRLSDAGYPFEQLHLTLHRWHQGLQAREEFSKEAQTPLALLTGGLHTVQALRRSNPIQVAGL